MSRQAHAFAIPLPGEAAPAPDEWKGAVAARWTLLNVSESGGEVYLIARRNRRRPETVGGLTERESQVVACAAMGHHNKLIAYNLGIAHSTVRVLIARAAARLGARSRCELVRSYGRTAEKP